MAHLIDLPSRVFVFYRDGFRRMTVGRTLWKIIFIKLFIMFAVLKLFFFPNYLNNKFKTDQQRSAYVLEQLTRTATNINEYGRIK